MPQIADFRTFVFDTSRVDASGRHLGRRIYWKLYAIENIVRVVVHSVLSAQIGPNWWGVAVDPGIQAQVKGRIADYAQRPWHSTPGRHEIYYVLLSDLNKIMTANSHLFTPHVPHIDQWIARIEQVRLPRNIVGHMNWLSTTDRNRIDVFHADVQQLVGHLATSLTAAGASLAIP